MTALWLDLRDALRSLARRPGFTLTAVLTLGLAIGVGTAVLGVVRGLLLRSVPGVTRTERLVEIRQLVGTEPYDLSFPLAARFRGEAAVVEDLAAFALVPVSVTADGEPIVAGGLAVSRSYFPLLGVAPVAGRLFASGEADFPAVAPVGLVTSHFADRYLGGPAAAAGRTVRVNGAAIEIVGVLPPGFAGHTVGLLADVFLPLGLAVGGLPAAEGLQSPTSAGVEVLARLRAGVAPAAAAAALTAAGGRLLADAGVTADQPFAVTVSPWGPLPAVVRGPAAAFLGVLLVLVALGVIMGGVNLTTMLLARAAEQERELAIRRALGASGLRLGRRIVAESVTLFLLAAALGTLLAWWATGLARGLRLPMPVPGRVALDFPVDLAVLAVVVAVAIGGGTVFSLAPAVRTARFPLLEALKAGGTVTAGRGSRLRGVLVAGQVGFTTLLLVAAVLFARALGRANVVEQGWSMTGVQVASFDLTLDGTSPAAGQAFYRALAARVKALPGVEAAATAAKLPLGGRSSLGLVTVPGGGEQEGVDAALNRVSPGYFRTLSIGLRRGRDFADADDAQAVPVAIVNETLAERLWPGGDPIGRTFTAGGPAGRSFTVVGVVPDLTWRATAAARSAFYYVPTAQWYNAEQTLHFKLAAGTVVPPAVLRDLVRELDPNLPMPVVRPLAEALAVFALPQRIAAAAAAVLGLFGLLLAVAGVAGITAYLVARRYRELGIRLALGATPRDLVRMLVRQVGRGPAVGVAVGIALGLVFSLGASRAVPGAVAGDPVALVLAPAMILLAAAAAIVVPVVRVLRRNPVRALTEA
ncbi:MAG: ABC transporter permease [Gemmatimonadales bacterium]